MSKKDRVTATLLMILCVVMAVVSLAFVWYGYATEKSGYLIFWNLVNAISAVTLISIYARRLQD